MTNNLTPSIIDDRHLKIIRNSVNQFVEEKLQNLLKPGIAILDIGPENWPKHTLFSKDITLHSIDIDMDSKSTFKGDITKTNNCLKSNFYDIVICTEVLEHTLNPFSAAKEIYRVTKNGGAVLVTTPFNFRIHGPLPDCWRFTEHGLKVLFTYFSECSITETVTPDRPLMPIQYQTYLRK